MLSFSSFDSAWKTTRGLGSRSFRPLRVRQAYRSSIKVAKPGGGPDTGQGAVPLCSGTPVLAEVGGGIDVEWRVGGGGKVKSHIKTPDETME